MKTYKILLCALVLGLAACTKDKFDDSIFIDPEENTGSATYQFDQWLDHAYREPYNVDFQYRLDDNATNHNYNLVPVSLGKADTLAHLALYLWYDVYDQVVSPTFIRDNGPKMIQLIGSPAINADQGTRILGTAEGGIKIVLYDINELDVDDIESMNELVFKTMHHEFSHILHQKKTYPKEFELITPADYDPNGWQYRTDEEANALGFVTPYASCEYHEDFVETIANYIVKTDADWEKIQRQAGDTGWAFITQKLDMARSWLAEKWELDLDAVRKEVQLRQKYMDIEKVMNCDFRHPID